MRFDLQCVQQAVDAADQIFPLAPQGFIRINVGFLLHLAGHQPLGLLTGPAHQLFQLAVQLLYLSHLGTDRRPLENTTLAFILFEIQLKLT